MIYRFPKIPPTRKIHGGKSPLCRRLISLAGDIRPAVFVDCTAGGGSMFLNINTSFYGYAKFIANDIDPYIFSMHYVVARKGGLVAKALSGFSYDEGTFFACKRGSHRGKLLSPSRVAHYIARYRMSCSGFGEDFAWSERLRGGRPGDLNAWENFKSVHFDRIREASSRWSFENMDVVDLIRKYDSPCSYFYIDLPYPFSTRTATNIYDHEMAIDRGELKRLHDRGIILQGTTHEDVIDAVTEAKGKFMISSYFNELYHVGLKGYRRVDFSVKNNSGRGKSKQDRVESIWMNF